MFWIFAWGLFKGRLIQGVVCKTFLVVGHIPDKIFLLANCFFNATYESNNIFLNDRLFFAN